MPNDSTPIERSDQPATYQVKLKGHLDAQWSHWFSGLTVTLAGNGQTVLTGRVADQAALHGLLKKVRDLGMPLISVNLVQTGQPRGPRA